MEYHNTKSRFSETGKRKVVWDSFSNSNIKPTSFLKGMESEKEGSSIGKSRAKYLFRGEGLHNVGREMGPSGPGLPASRLLETGAEAVSSTKDLLGSEQCGLKAGEPFLSVLNYVKLLRRTGTAPIND